MNIDTWKENTEGVRRIHPALDFIGDTAYVAVQVLNINGMQDVILSSERDVFDLKEWGQYCIDRSLSPYENTPDLSRCSARWNTAGIKSLAGDTLALDTPDWQETYSAIYDALATRLVVYEQSHLTVLTLQPIVS